jgi:hypothetical protein
VASAPAADVRRRPEVPLVGEMVLCDSHPVEGQRPEAAQREMVMVIDLYPHTSSSRLVRLH